MITESVPDSSSRNIQELPAGGRSVGSLCSSSCTEPDSDPATGLWTHVSWCTGLSPGASSTLLTQRWNAKTFLKNLYGLNIPPHATTMVRAMEKAKTV